MSTSSWYPFIITVSVALFVAGMPLILMRKLKTKVLLIGTIFTIVAYLLLTLFCHLISNNSFINIALLELPLNNKWGRALLIVSMFLLPMCALSIFALANNLVSYATLSHHSSRTR